MQDNDNTSEMLSSSTPQYQQPVLAKTDSSNQFNDFVARIEKMKQVIR